MTFSSLPSPKIPVKGSKKSLGKKNEGNVRYEESNPRAVTTEVHSF